MKVMPVCGICGKKMEYKRHMQHNYDADYNVEFECVADAYLRLVTEYTEEEVLAIVPERQVLLKVLAEVRELKKKTPVGIKFIY